MENKKALIKKVGLYLTVAIIAAFASLGIFAGGQYFRASNSSTEKLLDNPAIAETAKAPQDGEGGVQQLKKTSEGFRKAVRIASPAVVNIKSTKGGKRSPGKFLGKRRKQAPQEDEEMPFDPFDFFRHFGQPFGQPFPEMDTPQTSLGSGFIIDKKGFIVTNNHVVQDASEILVSLANEKTEIKAKLVGTDPKTDLAVLKMETTRELPVLEWADSDGVEVGDWVLAIGSPFDLKQTVTAGIISAKGRSGSVVGGDFYGDFIQTDAAINPGNSGGPLVTLDGQVTGVNTAIFTRSGGYMGIGFAIPSNLAKDVVQKLRTDGKIVRGWLGVYIQALSPKLAKEMGLKEGVGVHEVMADSPAEKAGIQAGDVIIEVEGKPVKEVNELQKIISSFKPGQTVKMKVVGYGDKKTRPTTVKIGEIPDEEVAEKGSKGEDSAPDKLGLIVSERKGKDGVVVQMIQPGSYADSVGLQPGDSILSVNRTKVKTVSAYKKAIGSRELNLEVERKGRKLFYSFELPE